MKFMNLLLEDNGKKDLVSYLFSKSQKSISDLFDAVKQMDRATSIKKRAKISRMNILEEASEKKYICSREWF